MPAPFIGTKVAMVRSQGKTISCGPKARKRVYLPHKTAHLRQSSRRTRQIVDRFRYAERFTIMSRTHMRFLETR